MMETFCWAGPLTSPGSLSYDEILLLSRYATGGVSRSRVAASLEAGEKFMQSQGLSEADIQHIEEKNPGALKSNVEKVRTFVVLSAVTGGEQGLGLKGWR
jgi:hypothetical protein